MSQFTAEEIRRAQGGKSPAEMEETIATLTAERDKAEGQLQMVNALVEGYSWLSEGRGPYAYDDGRYDDDVMAFTGQLLELMPKFNWLGMREWEAKYRATEAQRDALRTALEFYADPWAWNRAQPDEESRVWIPDLYGELEFGSRAREALGGSREHNKADYDL